MKYKELRQFKPEELLFDEAETRTVLKFIFAPADHALIDSLPMTDALREFAQGLLVEAIDASYAVGFVRALHEVTANPTKTARQILKEFGKKALLLWFEHATVHDLQDVKIYEFVLAEIARRFRTRLPEYAAGLRKRLGAFLAYEKPRHGIVKIWS